MDLTSDHPFWFVRNGLMHTYPFISKDEVCDIVVIGAGITGAMVAQRLAEKGFSIIVVDRRDVGTGSTAASTALLQYEIDLPLVKMATVIGRDNAIRAYRASHDSIDQITDLVQRLKLDCDFQRKTSIYFASDRAQAKMLAEEARLRREIGLDIHYHNQKSLRDTFGLEGIAALSSEQAASCDGYRMCHALLQNTCSHGGRVYDRTEIKSYDCTEQGVCLTTHRGPVVRARTAILATGYESTHMLQEKVVDLGNTYALVSHPLEDVSPWNENWMMWEAKNPYLYLRMTADRRLLVGGEDDAFHGTERRDQMIGTKTKIIESKVRKLIPALDWEIEFAWAGTFGTTKDGLAYIGATPEYPNCVFALGFGGNGITFSAIAAQLIADSMTGKPTANADLYRFGR